MAFFGKERAAKLSAIVIYAGTMLGGASYARSSSKSSRAIDFSGVYLRSGDWWLDYYQINQAA